MGVSIDVVIEDDQNVQPPDETDLSYEHSKPSEPKQSELPVLSERQGCMGWLTKLLRLG